MKNKAQHINEAKVLLRQQHSGVLATNSLSMKGFPFGSITPFLMAEDGDIIIYASDIAQHSRNMHADAKVSLCVFDPAQQDSQSNARITLMAEARSGEVNETEQSTYFRLFPKAIGYKKTHDFHFYRLQVERVRYIGGFGDIFWFSKDDWKDSFVALTAQAAGVISHMHDDHKDALVDVLSYVLKVQTHEESVDMLTCFAEGFHVRIKEGTTVTMSFIPYLSPIVSKDGIRRAMVMLTNQSRKAALTG